jgi:carotenoid cleavage dioxygenase
MTTCMAKNAPQFPAGETRHWALSGGYAPVHQEITATDLRVTGVIPDFLDGRYMRIGPNPIRVSDPAHYEVFLGTGMVHGLRIADGRAQWYRNRWVRSASVARTLGERWNGGPGHGGFDFAANTNVIRHAGRTLALAEAGVRPYELSDTLDTIGGFDFHGTLRGGYAALPKRDPKTGELHAISYSLLFGHTVRYTVAGVDGRIRRTVDIKLTSVPLMHDFSLTERYVVVYDQPVILDWTVAAKRPWSRLLARQLNRSGKRTVPELMANFLMAASAHVDIDPRIPFPFQFDQNQPARAGVLPRTGTAADIRWFDIPRCLVFHALNAYEEGDQIVLDVLRHPDLFTGPNADPTTHAVTLDRWTIDLVGGTVHEQRLDDHGQEFPRVDDRLVGRPYRYGYCVEYPINTDPPFTPGAQLLRHDVLTGSTQEVSFGDHSQAGEFVFVPRDDNASENDGVLMGFVYDAIDDRSELMLLDAGSLELIGAVHVPARVPHGFHGNWMPT